MTSVNIALLGDYSEDVTAHRTISPALALSARQLDIDCQITWIHSSEIVTSELTKFHGFWCVPNSPYTDPAKILAAIKYARESETAFIGTCGGYQHAALEYAIHALGYTNAGNTEENPDTDMPLISTMLCTLREKQGDIRLTSNSRLHTIYQSELVHEEYNCGFGVNRDYLSIFDNTDLTFTGFDEEGDPRALEHGTHPFFIGTAFQPERSALSDNLHPVITEFLRTAAINRQSPVISD